MSIAVNAVLHPSRLLRLALAAFALAACAAAVLAALVQAPRFQLPRVIGLACLGVAGLAARAASRPATTRVLDVSGLGALRLSVQRCDGPVSPDGQALQLLPGSTLWSGVLILLLRPAGGGALSVLLILPDSVAPGQFRQLGVALRTIARRDNKFSEINKIF